MSYKGTNTMSRTLTFQPSEEQSNFIESQVEAGRFQNQSEVVRAGLRLLQEQEAKSKLQQLRELISEAENSPTIKGWTKDEFLNQIKIKMNGK
jgi:antitoxin ParD1/3/4